MTVQETKSAAQVGAELFYLVCAKHTDALKSTFFAAITPATYHRGSASGPLVLGSLAFAGSPLDLASTPRSVECPILVMTAGRQVISIASDVLQC